MASTDNDENMFDDLVEKSKSSPSYRTALGGNAPVRKFIRYINLNKNCYDIITHLTSSV